MTHVWTGREEKIQKMPAARRGLEVLAIGYPRGPLNSPDDAVLDVISDVLTAGPDAYLQTKLVQARRAGAVAGAASYPTQTGGGLLAVLAVPVPGGSFDDLRKLVQSAIDELAEKPLADEALLAAKRRFLSSAVRLLEEDGSAADMLARTSASLGSAKSLADVMKQLEAVTPADVQRVAKQYLKADAASWVTWTGERR
jgi:predicted Zn-dependent peptidase